MWEGVEPDPAMFVDHPDDIDWPLAEDPGTDLEPPVDLVDEHQVDALEEDLVDVDEDQYVEGDLTLAAYIRDLGGTRLEPTDADIRLMYQRADEWHSSPVTRERMLEINEHHAGLLRVPVHRLVGPRLPHRPVRRRPRRRTSTSVPVRRRPGGPTWSTTCAAAASATPRCWPPASPPAPAPAD